MIAVCRECGEMFADIPEEDAFNPNGYECGACWRSRHPKDQDEDDLPDTDVITGDDPDDYIPD